MPKPSNWFRREEPEASLPEELKDKTPEQVAALVAVHRTQMARFGYVPPGL